MPSAAMFRELAPVALIVLLGIMSIYISFTTLVKVRALTILSSSGRLLVLLVVRIIDVFVPYPPYCPPGEAAVWAFVKSTTERG